MDGWMRPYPNEVAKDYPWITDHKGKSITELEDPPWCPEQPENGRSCILLLPRPGFTKTLPESQQADLLENPSEQEMRDYGQEEAGKRADTEKSARLFSRKGLKNLVCHFMRITAIRIQFGELLQEDLMRVIDSLAPVPKPLSEAERANAVLDREDMAHEAFAANPVRGLHPPAGVTLTVLMPMPPETARRL